MYRLQLLGFNAVRLPFSFSDLYDKQPASMQRNCAQVRDKTGASPGLMRKEQSGVFQCLSNTSCSRKACSQSLLTATSVRPEDI